MQSNFRIKALCAALFIAASPMAFADAVNDAFGDYLPTFTGSKAGDLDVLTSFVTYNQATDKFVFSGTFAADVGLTPGGFYVWGINRGAGTAAFATNGLPNVLFDAVVVLRQDGSITANGTALAAGTAKIFGSTIIGEVSGSLLPSTGFAKTAYTWNLWPRDPSQSGFAAISDFAPNTNNLGVTVVGAVPEPGTVALLAAGLIGVVGWSRRGKNATLQAI